MPFKIGLGELVLILFAIMIIFGAGKLPQVGKALGDMVKNIRQLNTDIKGGINDDRKD